MIVVLQVVDIQNKLFHSANFKLTKTEMKKDIRAMISLLEDTTRLKYDVHAQEAVRKLQQVTQNH